MKKREARETAIGGIALAVFAVLLAASYRAEPGAAPAAGAYRVNATFNRIDGLLAGDPVYLAGVRVGSVDGLTLTPDYRAEVTFRIDQGVALPADTAAAIHTDGLFGSKFVTLDPGGAEETLADGGAIRYTQDALIVSNLLDLIIAEGKAARRRAESTTTGE